MTLQQLKYVCMVEKYGSITKAAQAMYVSQPGLSSMIHALEEELGIRIFLRSPMGVTITEEGRELVRMAGQLLNDAEHMEDYFKGNHPGADHPRFLVSSQHYDFVVSACTRLINELDISHSGYSLGLSQTSTGDVIEDVCRQRSSLGILYLPGNDRKYMERSLTDRGLTFTPLTRTKPHVFIDRSHPLAGKPFVTPEDLEPYPCIAYRQNEDSPSFYLEEISLPGFSPEKIIYISDLYVSVRMIRECNAYDIGTGIISSKLAAVVAAVPLQTDTVMELGYICMEGHTPGKLEQRFIELLKEEICSASLNTAGVNSPQPEPD